MSIEQTPRVGSGRVKLPGINLRLGDMALRSCEAAELRRGGDAGVRGYRVIAIAKAAWSVLRVEC